MTEQSKKVIRRKRPKSLKEKEKEYKMGRPSLSEVDPTEEMVKFAYMVGMGVEPKYAADQCGFSAYQRREYLKLPQIRKIIESARKAREYDSVKQIIDEWHEIQMLGLIEVKKRIQTGELKEQNLMKILSTSLASAGIVSLDGTIKPAKPKQITSGTTTEEEESEDLDEKKKNDEEEEEDYSNPYDTDVEDAEYEEEEEEEE